MLGWHTHEFSNELWNEYNCEACARGDKITNFNFQLVPFKKYKKQPNGSWSEDIDLVLINKKLDWIADKIMKLYCLKWIVSETTVKEFKELFGNR